MKISRLHTVRAGCQAQRYWVSRRFGSRISEIRSLRKDDDIYERPDGLSAEEQKEWDAMMENPVVHDLFHGMGSSGQSEGERYRNAPDDPLTPQEIALLMKMGSWRIGRLVIPQIELMVSQIESAWREILPDLSPSDCSPDYAYLDTIDPKGTRDMSHNLPDPPKEDPAWPRMQIENRVYQSYCFRKLHMEVVVKQDGMQVLHCVMYPRNTFDLPILSMDVVAYKGRPSFLIIDPCPVTTNLSLPPLYAQSVQAIQKKYDVATNRSIPDWGKEIFSEYCILMRPEAPADVGKFIKYALALTHFHVQFARLANPVDPGKIQKRKEIYEAHARYSRKQLENDKTRRVLAQCFGNQLADDYMSTYMFDVEPF